MRNEASNIIAQCDDPDNGLSPQLSNLTIANNPIKLSFGNLNIATNIFSFLLMPKQINCIKQVCKLWQTSIENIPYLRVDDNLQKSPNRTVMAIAPVNSSGDIYQMLAFTILSLADKKQVPPIILGYDTETTKRQVDRSKNLANLLGYEDFFYSLKVPYNNSSQPPARNKSLLATLKEKKVTYYMDQRLCTTIISDYIRENTFTKTTDLVRAGFNKLNVKALNEDNNLLIDQYIGKKIELIKKENECNKPTLIIHYRYSDKANKKQNMCHLVPHILTTLEKDYNLVGIYADSRKKGACFKEASVNIYPFKSSPVSKIKDVDVSKLCHLKLLIRLYEEKDNINLKGIIGNTSGTLDIAALIGHNVFNIHNFCNPITYQDYRLMLQYPFLHIENGEGILSPLEPLENFQFNLVNLQIDQKILITQNLNVPDKSHKYAGLGKIGFYSLSSVMHTTFTELTDRFGHSRWVAKHPIWEEQKFFTQLEDYLNEKFVEHGYFKEPFYPPVER